LVAIPFSPQIWVFNRCFKPTVTREVVFVRYFRAPLRRLELKQIANKKPCVAYDILFGCPGWIEGVLQANAYIKSGMAQRCLVIGSETLSRVVDDHKRLHDLFRRGWPQLSSF
jgi:hypothetical protein